MKIRVQEGHAHALTLYEPTNLMHFVLLLISIVTCSVKGYKTLTHHFPYEVEHPWEFSRREHKMGYFFIRYGEFLKKLFAVKLYWENSPVLEYGKWWLKYGQTEWGAVPASIELCLDTGHAMLGAKNKTEARRRLAELSDMFSSRIKHLHLHENDLKTDKHTSPLSVPLNRRIINPPLFKKLTQGRSFIIEIPLKIKRSS